MIRILQIIGSLNMGGAENFIVNLYRNIDRKAIQFDFLLYEQPSEKNFYEEVEGLGAQIYYAPSKKKGFRRNFEAIKKVVKQNKYQIVWKHTDNCFAGIDVIAAKLGGAERLILHSHNTRCNGLQRLLHYICKPIVNSIVTNRFACGEQAGKWLYGKKEFITIANGIDIKRFCFCPETRMTYRQELQLEDKFVIGNIGRFVPEKNHSFMIEIFREISTRQDNVILLLAGEGEQLDNIYKKVARLGLEDKVFFLKTRKDIPEIMQAMDLLCMPSVFEGFPMVLIEAQAAGLPCVVSDVITREVDVTGNLRFVSLNEGVQVWGDVIEHLPNVDRVKTAEVVKKAGYDAKDVALEIQRMFIEL